MTKRIFIASLFAASFFSAQAEDLYLDGTTKYSIASGTTKTFDNTEIYGSSSAQLSISGTGNLGIVTIEKGSGITSNSGFEVLSGGVANASEFYVSGGLANMAGTMNVTDRFSVGGIYDTKFVVLNGGKLYTNGVDMFADGTISTYNLRIEGYMKNVGDMVMFSQAKTAGLSISTTGKLETDTLTLNAAKVDISGTVDVNQITINTDQQANSSFKLWSAGVLNINGTSTLTDTQNTGTINVNAGITQIASSGGFLLQAGTLNINDGARMNAIFIDDGANPYVFRVQINPDTKVVDSRINIKGSGILDLSKTKNNNDLVIDASARLTVTSEKSNSIIADKITFFNNTTLTLNSKKTFVGEAGDYNITLMAAQGIVANVNVNALSQFGGVQLQQGSKLIFNMGSGADSVLVLDAIVQYLTHVGSIVFNDFNNEKVFFLDMSELPSFATISGTGVNGKTLTNSDFSLIAGEFNGESGYWLYAAGVPEPSTFAAIFGASALALALYRRRRKI